MSFEFLQSRTIVLADYIVLVRARGGDGSIVFAVFNVELAAGEHAAYQAAYIILTDQLAVVYAIFQVQGASVLDCSNQAADLGALGGEVQLAVEYAVLHGQSAGAFDPTNDTANAVEGVIIILTSQTVNGYVGNGDVSAARNLCNERTGDSFGKRRRAVIEVLHLDVLKDRVAANAAEHSLNARISVGHIDAADHVILSVKGSLEEVGGVNGGPNVASSLREISLVK